MNGRLVTRRYLLTFVPLKFFEYAPPKLTIFSLIEFNLYSAPSIIFSMTCSPEVAFLPPSISFVIVRVLCELISRCSMKWVPLQLSATIDAHGFTSLVFI
jgi:hypothetical protein